MKTTIIPEEADTETKKSANPLHFIARKIVLKSLSAIQNGRITLHEGTNVHHFGKSTEHCSLQVDIRILHPDVYIDVTCGGTIGAGEAYIKGLWSCNNLTHLIRIFVINRNMMLNMDKRLTRLSMPFCKLLHWLNRNSKAGSSRNIKAHYDIGNDFFRLFLDETLMYSSAIYPHEQATLKEASEHKLTMACKKLNLQADDHLLEIGTGWGSLAIHAAREYGCQVTTTTISEQQYTLAKQRVAEAGLSDQVTVIMQDYRDLHGQYDKLVSIEMIEAVGYQHFDTFFRQCSKLLKPTGLMLLQTIIIADELYENAKKSVDFIQRYIFPGGCLPAMHILTSSAAKTGDLRILHVDEFGEHYARTLRDWYEQFMQKLAQVKKLGYPETFVRMWEYYLCYCEGGFVERSLGVTQILLAKPLNRREPLLINATR